MLHHMWERRLWLHPASALEHCKPPQSLSVHDIAGVALLYGCICSSPPGAYHVVPSEARGLSKELQCCIQLK